MSSRREQDIIFEKIMAENKLLRTDEKYELSVQEANELKTR